MAHPERRDLEATRGALERFLARRVPGTPRVRELRAPSDTGFSSDTLLADLEMDGGTRHVVVRIRPRGFNVFPDYDLTVQWRVMDALAATEVPVPRLLWHEWGEETLGAPFYVMERIEGWVPSDRPPMHVGGRIAEELGPAEREAVWWSGVDALARVHRVDPLALGLGFLDEPARGATPLEQHLRYWDDYFSWAVAERGRYAQLERALRWLARTRPEEDRVGLCWGDSRLANQIFRGTSCVGVLDWEMVRLGDPTADLAWWVATDRCFTEGIGVPRLPGIPGRDETVARWEEWTGRKALHLDWYEVFALMRFSAVMARVGLQMKHYGVAPEEADFDVHNLASVTLERKLDELGP